jgi:hypothetical protein
MKLKQTDEYATFHTALIKVLRVSHSEMKARIAAERREKKRKKKQPSARASSAKG